MATVIGKHRSYDVRGRIPRKIEAMNQVSGAVYSEPNTVGLQTEACIDPLRVM